MCRFLAPETLSSKWSPKSDVWAAGVMAHQLLTGRLPFNDKRNLYNPALSAVLRSILTDKLDFQKAYWADISDDGKDFVKCAPPHPLLPHFPSREPSCSTQCDKLELVGYSAHTILVLPDIQLNFCPVQVYIEP